MIEREKLPKWKKRDINLIKTRHCWQNARKEIKRNSRKLFSVYNTQDDFSNFVKNMEQSWSHLRSTMVENH